MPEPLDLRRFQIGQLLTRLEENFPKLDQASALSLCNDLEARAAVERFFSDVPAALQKAKLVLPELVQSDLDVLQSALARLDGGVKRVRNDILLSNKPLTVSDFEFASQLLSFLGPKMARPAAPEMHQKMGSHSKPKPSSIWKRGWITVGVVGIAVPILAAIIPLIVKHPQAPATSPFAYTGAVVDDTHKPVIGATVSVEVDGSAPVLATSDSDGIFHLELSGPGQPVQIAITAPGYRDLVKETSLNGTGRGSYILQKLPATPPKDNQKTEVRHKKSPPRPHAVNAATVVITDESQRPLPGVDVLVLMPNATYLQAITDENGFATFDDNVQVPVTLYGAHPSFHHIYKTNLNLRGAIPLTMKKNADGGSVIIANRNGYIPGLAGRLNPILDSAGRTYLYADNIAIDGGKTQPATFTTGRAFELRDSHGHAFEIDVVSIIGSSSLIEYRRKQE